MARIIYEIDHVSQLYKRGKVKANVDITLQVQEGEILGVLGPNGAGKSTLIKQMIGHLQPTEGKVSFYGTDVVQQTRRVAQQVAYYSQEPHVLASLKVQEALVFTGRLRGMTKLEAERQAEELLEMMGMTELRRKQLKHLSGGQRRMIGIGTVMIGSLPVMILDEPTNELDPANRRLVWNLIKERNLQGATVILVTHNVLEAEQVVDRVAVINHGRLLAIDAVAKLKQKVDQRLKFELITEFGRREEAAAAMRQWGHLHINGENRLILLVDKESASQVLDYIVHFPELPIEEYAVKPPSLEDVYFHIDGQAEREASGA
ncbi:ABC transporter ATP-binding protein [Paenibacillus sp. OSY-SE]|uniref:ABC transporter ATP-binding protein n=1 Tax=Paenibacillus sp. OSY-SE TaxID=1196323 RepID=UPI0002FC60B8|nr:ABC transporter ATP-binding protein [Paenibacillus sp. OSY-SE]